MTRLTGRPYLISVFKLKSDLFLKGYHLIGTLPCLVDDSVVVNNLLRFLPHYGLMDWSVISFLSWT